MVLPFLLRLPILLSLSPKVASLGGFSCRPPSLVVPVFVFGVFLSVAAVLCLLPLLLLGVTLALAEPPLVCLFSLSWDTCGFSAPCHAAGCPSGVPLLADSGWLPYSCGDGFAWGWGCLSTDVLLPPWSFFFVTAQLPLPLLPLRGSAPLTGELACLTPACWSTPRVGLEGSCCVLFLRACSVRCFPCCRFP